MINTQSTHTAAVFTGETENLKLITLSKVITPVPKKNEILVQVIADALNPVDWKHITLAWGKKGCVPGLDSAGIVAAVGSDVVGFKVGDHVSAFIHGGFADTPQDGTYQEYFIADPYHCINFGAGALGYERSSSVSPAKITTFEGASSITLAVLTVGLSYYNNFKLKFDKKQQEGKAILIWGGATATGFIAVQIAKKVFGLQVLVTASRKHENVLKALGVDKLFDYHDADVVQQIKAYPGEKLVYGYDTISSIETMNQVYDSLADSAPSITANLLRLSEDSIVKKKSNVKTTYTLSFLARGQDQILSGVLFKSSKEIKADHEEFWNRIAKYVTDGTIKHAPLNILPHGFNSIDKGLSLLRNDKVSGEKLIIRVADTFK